ncbi:MAG TPA: hypothetical protein DCX80_11690 [Chloroflexi bacterium]|nr:hypothetical protein [Chloroflexota bacterium]
MSSNRASFWRAIVRRRAEPSPIAAHRQEHQLDIVGDLIVNNAVVRLRIEPDGTIRPAIHACEVRLPNAGFIRIVEQLLADPVKVGPATVRYESARLIDGGVEIVVRARRGILNQPVTTRVRLSPAGNGQLRATVADLRLGPFGANWLLEHVLGSVNHQPGMRLSGPKSIDVDIAALLRERDIPLDWEAGVDIIQATPEALVIVMT